MMNDEEERTTYDTSEVSSQSTESKAYSQADVDKLLKEKDEANQKAWNKRWGQEKAKIEMQNAKKDELISLIQKQTKTDSIDSLLDLTYKQYRVERPVNTRDEEVLGRNDAQELFKLDDESIAEEANNLAAITNRTARQQAKFMELGKYLTDKKNQEKRNQELKEAGISEEVYNSDAFQDTLKKFNQDTSLNEVYDFYLAKNKNQKEKPFSAGSLKDSGQKQDSEYFTEEEFNALTAEDLKDPRIFDKAMKSRSRF